MLIKTKEDRIYKAVPIAKKHLQQIDNGYFMFDDGIVRDVNKEGHEQYIVNILDGFITRMSDEDITGVIIEKEDNWYYLPIKEISILNIKDTFCIGKTVQLLESGFLVKRKIWKDKDLILKETDEEKIICEIYKDGTIRLYEPKNEDILAKDWELVK